MTAQDTAGGRPSIVVRASVLLLVLVALRVLEQTWLRTGLSLDGLEQYAHAQSWAWGYSLKQPPLYTWLLKLLDVFLDNTLLAEVLLRQMLIVASVACIYVLARRGGLRVDLALASAAGMFVIVDYVYTGQATLTHTHACITALCAALLVFHYVVRTGAPWAYVLFGVLCGAAVLSKYIGVIPVAAILAAGAATPATRGAVLNRRMLIGLAAMLATVAPHLVWWLAQSGDPDVGIRLWRPGFTNALLARVVGTAGVVLSMLGECALLILAAGVALLRPNGGIAQPQASSPFSVPVAGIVLAGLIVTLVGVGISGTTNIVMRWMLPLAMFAPLALMVVVKDRPDAHAMARNIIYVAYACGAVALLFGTIDDLTGGNRTTYDYRRMAADIAATAGPVDAILPLGDSAPINMGLYMQPEPAILAFEQMRPPTSGRVLVIWPAEAGLPEDAGKVLATVPGLARSALDCAGTVRLEQEYGTLGPEDYCVTLLDPASGATLPLAPAGGG